MRERCGAGRAALREAGPTAVLTDAGQPAAAQRTVQELEIAIDALDIMAIGPFWKTVLGYVNETAT